jgi:hypothetical protein
MIYPDSQPFRRALASLSCQPIRCSMKEIQEAFKAAKAARKDELAALRAADDAEAMPPT